MTNATTTYDYDLQAWIVDGKVDHCGHHVKRVGCVACHCHGMTTQQATLATLGSNPKLAVRAVRIRS